MAHRNETFIALILGLVLLISVMNEFVAAHISNNFQSQIEQDLALSKAYGETTAIWLEANELLQRNLSAGLQGLLNKTVEQSAKFDRNNFSQEDWERWKDKSVIEFWKYSYDKTWSALQKSLKDVNDRRHSQLNFIEKNRPWEILERILRVLQISLIIIVLYMYLKFPKQDSK